MTLDCLKYVGSVISKGAEHVLIKDEKGKVHELKLGSYMGENSGLISKIDRDAIYLDQVVSRNGEWVIVTVKFSKK